jgi:uncharacterized protein YdeI (YjbR/CyaY-like superfamily)
MGSPGSGDLSEELAPDGKPMVGPFDRAAWRRWLIDNQGSSKGVYLVSWRRRTGRASVSYEEAVEEALCVGWIDGQSRRRDQGTSLQRMTPRTPRSTWSFRNVERVERLEREGRMRPAGLAAVDAAKADGRWDAAYLSQAD